VTPALRSALIRVHTLSSLSIWPQGREWFTLRNTSGKLDWQTTEPLSAHKPIDYVKPDGKLSFPLLTNLQRRWTIQAWPALQSLQYLAQSAQARH